VLSNEMHAIINLHHDGADGYDGVEWITLNDADGEISETNNDAVRTKFTRIWEQIAERFREYDDRLLFESMNEIHDGYDAPDTEYHTIINHLNQAFVDTIRNRGGNNASRYLVLPGYNTNIDYTLDGFELPRDTAEGRLILSVHYYDPWSFAGSAETPVWGAAYDGADSWGQEDFVLEQFDKLKETYIDQGIPVVIGEYGAVNQAGAEAYRRYYMEYVTKAAVDRAILPIYWDNGGSGSGEENFGMFDRNSNQVLFPDIMEAMMRAATNDYAIEDIETP